MEGSKVRIAKAIDSKAIGNEVFLRDYSQSVPGGGKL